MLDERDLQAIAQLIDSKLQESEQRTVHLIDSKLHAGKEELRHQHEHPCRNAGKQEGRKLHLDFKQRQDRKSVV